MKKISAAFGILLVTAFFLVKSEAIQGWLIGLRPQFEVIERGTFFVTSDPQPIDDIPFSEISVTCTIFGLATLDCDPIVSAVLIPTSRNIKKGDSIKVHSLTSHQRNRVSHLFEESVQ